MATYEYEIIKTKDIQGQEDYLNDIGASGWHVIALETVEEEQTAETFITSTYIIVEKPTLD